ncbi:XRE family transcriptional regulator [Microbacterium sp. SORGH_AS_0862]|uniref:helix-turn-helix domain-containing protein n=1 Tax=Microbacterium sp. SORGH_AS_0862 TaxID=3041789 RepID=UPI002794D6B0|nr:XRE family transcriptional regulator [Microbacterium sp. SORGH_AS_0862]MDQ1204627.1 Zn-dependent peptidase ImmA (M78 family)/DNA-binding XRE family transcriptional regulator [Microbacterium sp. SORGH_AS_0862]
MALDLAALSGRIARARTEAGLTQAELANGAGLDRTAIAKIETGARGVSALELARIATTVGQRIEWLLTDGPESVVAYRVRRDASSSLAEINRELERLARDVEFLAEQVDSLTLAQRDPWEVPRSLAEADELAARARHALNIQPNAPVLRLTETLSPLGLLVFVSDLGPNAADGGTVLLASGGVSLVNGASQLGRRRLTAAHELAHFLVADDFTVDWRISEGAESDRTEALFDRFARSFLLPSSALTEYWASVSDEGPRAAAVRTASKFQVDMATLATRLTESGILPREDAHRVRGVQTTKADILEYELFVPYELERQILPSVYERAVLSLYRGERISAERALELLRGKYEGDDLPPLATPNESELWSILN